MSASAQEHQACPGLWPQETPLAAAGRIGQGLGRAGLVRALEGHNGCMVSLLVYRMYGRVIGVNQAAGRRFRGGSQYDSVTGTVSHPGRREISAWFVCAAPLGPPRCVRSSGHLGVARHRLGLATRRNRLWPHGIGNRLDILTPGRSTRPELTDLATGGTLSPGLS